MTWWQMSAFVVGALVIFTSGAVAALTAVWRLQERKDGKR